MHVGVKTLVAIGDGVDHRRGTLGAGSIVQKRQRESAGDRPLQNRKIVTTMGKSRHVGRRCGFVSGKGRSGRLRFFSWGSQGGLVRHAAGVKGYLLSFTIPHRGSGH